MAELQPDGSLVTRVKEIAGDSKGREATVDKVSLLLTQDPTSAELYHQVIVYDNFTVSAQILLPMVWKVTFYNEKVEGEALALPPGILASLLRITELIEEFGP